MYPVVLYVVLASFALPVIAAGLRQRELDRSQRLVAMWYVVLVIENVTSILWSQLFGNNLVVSKIFLPIEALFVLLAIAEWQVRPIARMTVMLCIPLYWLTWSWAFAYVEQPTIFSTVAGPILGFLVLVSTLFAYVTRVQQEDGPVLDTAWGWILPGLAIFFAMNVSVTIFLAYAQQAGLSRYMVHAAILRATIYLLATLIVTGGYVWPTRQRPSGRSSSPAPSP